MSTYPVIVKPSFLRHAATISAAFASLFRHDKPHTVNKAGARCGRIRLGSGLRNAKGHGNGRTARNVRKIYAEQTFAKRIIGRFLSVDFHRVRVVESHVCGVRIIGKHALGIGCARIVFDYHGVPEAVRPPNRFYPRRALR